MSRLATAIAAFVAAWWCVPALADTQVGVQGIVLSGTHAEPGATFGGTGEGVLLSLDQRWRAVQLHFEGIPNIATANVNSGNQAVTATIGVFAGSARFRLDRAGRYWLGAGTELLSQTTPLRGLGQLFSSRLAGSRYEFATTLPLSPNHFIETDFAGAPSLSGNIHEVTFFQNGFQVRVSGVETASMMDLSGAYGIRSGRFEYLFGLRSINFAAKFANGSEADRNVGTGVTAAIRFSL